MVYHVVNKSIAGFEILNNADKYERMIMCIYYYSFNKQAISFSRYFRDKKDNKGKFSPSISTLKSEFGHNKKIVNIIAYCLMPTHIHLMLEELENNGISIFISNILNSYARYFNLKLKRKGPLWQGRFRKVNIKTDEQLLHTTSYLHLNPVVAGLVEKPEQWNWSSYGEYIATVSSKEKICNYESYLWIKPEEYKSYANGNILYQKEMAKLKKISLE